MTKRTIIALLSAVLLAAASAPAATLSPKQLWQKADDYASNKLYIDAVNTYTQAIHTNRGEIAIDEVSRVFSSRGLAYQALKEYDKALDDFSNAIKLDERNAEFYLNRGQLRVLTGDTDKALEDYNKAVELAPRNTTCYLLRGAVYLELRDPDRAAADYARVLEYEPKNNTALYNFGLANRLRGQYEKALEAFNTLLELDPKHQKAPYQEAAIFSRLGKIDSACIWLETAAENGFKDWNAVRNDPDFDKLRDVSCYRKVLSGK